MLLIANTQLTGDYGLVSAGQVFEVSDKETYRQLLREGKANSLEYEAKIVRPEVKPLTATPFRDVPDTYQEPEALATLRNSVRETAEVPEQRDSDRFERRKRGRPRLR